MSNNPEIPEQFHKAIRALTGDPKEKVKSIMLVAADTNKGAVLGFHGNRVGLTDLLLRSFTKNVAIFEAARFAVKYYEENREEVINQMENDSDSIDMTPEIDSGDSTDPNKEQKKQLTELFGELMKKYRKN